MKRRKQGRRLGVALLAALCLSGTGAMTVSAASLPDHIVNGNFSYPSNLNWSQGEGIFEQGSGLGLCGQWEAIYRPASGRMVHCRF